MRTSSRVRFADSKIEETFYNLQKGDPTQRKLFSNVKRTLDKIESDAWSGTQIPKRLIPEVYKKKYCIPNLWKHNLPGGWRLLYSIDSQSTVIISIILEWLPHKHYERKFQY